MGTVTAQRPSRAQGPRIVEASRVDPASSKVLDDFSYTVLLDPKPARTSGDRRDTPRRRTRLRSGKVVDARGVFITECLVHDLSDTGGRIRVPADVAVPAFIHVYDDQSDLLHRAEVLWRRDGEAGLRFVDMPDTPRSRAIANEMRRKFYKVQY